MPYSVRTWDMGLVFVATIVVVVCVVVMFPRSEMIAIAREDTGAFLLLSVSIGIAAFVGGILGNRRPLPGRVFKGLWPFVWGGVISLTVGVFGLASTDLSLWFLVPLSLVTAIFFAKCRKDTVAPEGHG